MRGECEGEMSENLYIKGECEGEMMMFIIDGTI